MDPDSLHHRFKRVKGVGSAKGHETMRLIAAPWPKKELVTVPRNHYPGTSACDAIGLVKVPGLTDPATWSVTWAVKKQILGPDGIVAGSRGHSNGDEAAADADDAEHGAPVIRRTDDTIEPAVFHALPCTFFEEILWCYQLGAVINVGAGDGALALACLRKRIPYTGFCHTAEHCSRLRDRLVDQVCAGALLANDPWNDPALVKALVGKKKTRNGPSRRVGLAPRTKTLRTPRSQGRAIQ
jgi:hypothetical protein